MLQFRVVVTSVPQNQIFARVERMLDGRFYDAESRSFVREIPSSQIHVRNDHGVLSLDLEAAGWEDGPYHLSLHDAAQPNLAAFYGEYVSVNDGMNLFRKCYDCHGCE